MLSRKRNHGTDRERGAVILEFAILAPLLILIVFTASELAFAWETSSKAETAVAGAARVAATARDNALSDYEVLRSIRGGLGSRADQVERVVVFRSVSSNNSVPAACLTAAGLANHGQDNVCSVYSGDELLNLDLGDFTAAPGGCLYPGNNWCPTQRTQPSNQLHFIGVHIVIDHVQAVGWLPGGDQPLVATAVARMEPPR